jgi:RES domain
LVADVNSGMVFTVPPVVVTFDVAGGRTEGVFVFEGAVPFKLALLLTGAASTNADGGSPPTGGEAAVITVRTTKALRLLDFTKIKDSGRALSYFQPDFNEQAEKNIFLRQLGSLISQPVRPGRESDYLITQTMAEYLAHVQAKPFDGLLYKSVQKKGGTNIVLFPQPKGDTDNAFPVAYVADSIKFFETLAIEYEHFERRLGVVNDDGEIVDYSGDDRFDEDE